jgi:hypothetical protein
MKERDYAKYELPTRQTELFCLLLDILIVAAAAFGRHLTGPTNTDLEGYSLTGERNSSDKSFRISIALRSFRRSRQKRCPRSVRLLRHLAVIVIPSGGNERKEVFDTSMFWPSSA